MNRNLRPHSTWDAIVCSIFRPMTNVIGSISVGPNASRLPSDEP
ncbi:hypothetical protein YT1_1941 [Rhodococcus ruber]|nr:hypothetical protein YT1_1941 [Rhodococcus ruber]